MAIHPFIATQSLNSQLESQDISGVVDETAIAKQQVPKTPEEMIFYLENLSKENEQQAFIKKTFEQDPITSENKLLSETVTTLQVRLSDTEHRHELMTRLNQKLADELSTVYNELNALKKTVIGSYSMIDARAKPKNEAK